MVKKLACSESRKMEEYWNPPELFVKESFSEDQKDYSSAANLTLKQLMDMTFPEQKESDNGRLNSDYFDHVRDKMQDLNDTDGKVKKLILRPGLEDEVLSEKFEVSMKCLSYFQQQNLPYNAFEPSNKSTPIYCLQTKSLIKGLQVAIATMKRIEISLFWIHSDYAFNNDDNIKVRPRFPPNTAVIVLVNLVDFIEKTIIDMWVNSGFARHDDFVAIMLNAHCRLLFTQMLHIHRMCKLKRKCLELEQLLNSDSTMTQEKLEILKSLSTRQGQLIGEFISASPEIRMPFPFDCTIEELENFWNNSLFLLISEINTNRGLKLDTDNTDYVSPGGSIITLAESHDVIGSARTEMESQDVSILTTGGKIRRSRKSRPTKLHNNYLS